MKKVSYEKVIESYSQRVAPKLEEIERLKCHIGIKSIQWYEVNFPPETEIINKTFPDEVLNGSGPSGITLK